MLLYYSDLLGMRIQYNSRTTIKVIKIPSCNVEKQFNRHPGDSTNTGGLTAGSPSPPQLGNAVRNSAPHGIPPHTD